MLNAYFSNKTSHYAYFSVYPLVENGKQWQILM